MTPFSTFITLLLATFVAGAAVPRNVAGDTTGNFLGLPIINLGAKNIIPNRYVVVYNSTFGDDAIDASVSTFSAAVAKRNIGKRSLTGKLLSTSVMSMKLNSWRCMVIDADDAMVMDIYNSQEVAYIEADTEFNINSAIAQTNAPVGLRRLSGARAGTDNYVFDESAGQGITVYVVDTGIKITHTEFEGRARFGGNFIDNVDDDENGHGSHVAGTVAGATFGVAKKADLVAVKVLGGEGGGSTDGVLRGMEFVANDVNQRNLKGKAVMNMSLGGAFSRAINEAINNLDRAGVVSVVAAGNEAQDTANTSPGSAPKAITVGAFDPRNDRIADFSNFGEAVDIFAPGVDTLSVGIESNTATSVLSGTSMASPHVAGLAAYIMSLGGFSTPASVTNAMQQLSDRSGAEIRVDQRTAARIGNTPRRIANNGIL